MAGQRNNPKAVTPRGVAIYPRLNSPDDKYNKAGEYKTKLALDADAAGLADFTAKVEALIDAKYDEVIAEITDSLTKQGKTARIAKAVAEVTKSSPFKAEEDDDTGDETGRILINAKLQAVIETKKGPWVRKPTIFDARGKAIKNPPMIGSGSEMKLSVELNPYFVAKDKTVGVSFRLEAAQVLKLVTGGSRDAGGYGFGAEEGDELEEMDTGGSPFGGSSGDDDGDDGL